MEHAKQASKLRQELEQQVRSSNNSNILSPFIFCSSSKSLGSGMGWDVARLRLSGKECLKMYSRSSPLASSCYAYLPGMFFQQL